jgi:hypothetical protein
MEFLLVFISMDFVLKFVHEYSHVKNSIKFSCTCLSIVVLEQAKKIDLKEQNWSVKISRKPKFFSIKIKENSRKINEDNFNKKNLQPTIYTKSPHPTNWLPEKEWSKTERKTKSIIFPYPLLFPTLFLSSFFQK